MKFYDVRAMLCAAALLEFGARSVVNLVLRCGASILR